MNILLFIGTFCSFGFFNVDLRFRVKKDNIVFVNHAYISDTTFVSQIIGKNTFSEGFPVKFPTNSLFVSVYLNLDNSQLSFGCRLTHNPP